MKPPDMSNLGTPTEVAEYLHTSVAQLARLRYSGKGPKFVKMGRRVLYRWSDVAQWLERNTMPRTDDPHDYAGDELAHVIRDLINDAVSECLGMANLDRPDLTEQQLFEYLLHDIELPVTRQMIHYAVIRREIVPTRLRNGNYFSKRDGLEWIRSRKQ